MRSNIKFLFFTLIEFEDKDMQNLDDVLPKYLLKFWHTNFLTYYSIQIRLTT